jgi:hypothetical protein
MSKSLKAGAAAVLLAAGVLAGARGASAQVYVPPPIRITPPANYSNILITREIGRVAVRQHPGRSRGSGAPGRGGGGARGGGAGRGSSGGGAPARHGGTTTFNPVAASIVPRRLAAKTPAHREEAERFFVELLSTYRDLLREKGAPENDVARAASFAVANSYSVYNGGRFLTERQLAGLREQMHEAFTEDLQFQRLTNREKQELYESYAITGMYVSAMYDGASKDGDRKVLGWMRELARTQLEETFGVSVSRINFTDGGVEYR